MSPVPKCSSPSQSSDFRPISLLPIISKVLEKFVARKWILPVISRKVSKSQFAYMPGPGSGTTTALTLLQHEILNFLDSSPGSVRILSVDFAKAFDKVLHSGILESASAFRLPKEATGWIKSFLTSRQQRVCVNGISSSWKSVTSGVPQGSVIGPLLFCLFVDDLGVVSRNSSSFKYADDLTILHFIRSADDDRLQHEFDNVIHWSKSRNLPLNESKCRVANITTKKSLVISPIRDPNGIPLPCVSSLSLLGLTITDDMRWNSHIETTIRRCCKRIYVLRNLKRSGCSSSVILHVYNAIIRPILIYAYPSFCNIPTYLQDKLLRFERRIFRIAGSNGDLTVVEAAEMMCKRLFESVVLFQSHPLRKCFTQRMTKTRASMQLQPIKAKTKRLFSSFIRFAR